MAAQNLPPTSIETQTNLTGSVTDIDESPDSPDANWLTASGSSTLRVGFATPTLAPVGTQTFRVYARCTNNGTYSQTLYPDGGAFSVNGFSNNGGSTLVDCVDETQDGFVTSFLEPTADTHDVTCTFGTPSMTENPSSSQTIRVYVGKYDLGVGLLATGGDPTIDCQVYEHGSDADGTGGTAITTIPSAAQTVTTTGEWVSWTFDADDLTTADGSRVNITLTCTDGGGGPNKRHIAIDSIEWVASAYNQGATYDLDVYESGVKSGDSATGTITSTTGELDTGTWAHTVLGTADGSNVELYITQTAGVEYLEIGAVEWQSDAEPTGHLYLGNSTDGVTEIYEAPIDTVNDNVFNYTSTVAQEYYSESPSIVPDTTEYARAGFGVGIGNVGNGSVTTLIHMVLDAPNAGYDIHATASLAPYNPHYRFRHLLTR